jgi:hypothetical protein
MNLSGTLDQDPKVQEERERLLTGDGKSGEVTALEWSATRFRWSPVKGENTDELRDVTANPSMSSRCSIASRRIRKRRLETGAASA